MIYFTADLHFRHDNIIRHCNRPFKTAEDMDKRLVENWNKTIKSNDEVYILGDLTMKGAEVANDFLRKLKGKKYLIKGNHDEFADKENFDMGLVEWVKDYHVINYKNLDFILFHFPILEWHKKHYGSVHLHGHIHSDIRYNLAAMEKKEFRFDAGVDANNYRPVGIDEIISWVV